MLPFWQLWTQFGLSPRRVKWRSLRAKCMGVLVGLLADRVWNGGSDLQAGSEIYHWGNPRFWLILTSQNDPLLRPQFPPPVWSIGGSISLCPDGSPTQIQVVHSDMDPRSCLLSCEPLALPWLGEPRVGMTPNLVILESRPHLMNPPCPDAGTAEGTRLGEGSREFVREGHGVSCLVPTSAGSRQGVNFGVFRANISFG